MAAPGEGKPKGGDASVEDAQEKLQKVSIKTGDDESAAADNNPAVVALRALNNQHKDVEKDYDKEWRMLKKKYLALYAPFYAQRREILRKAPEGVTAAAASGTPAVEGFWLTAFNKNSAVSYLVKDDDEPILNYLIDVRSEWLDDVEQSSFCLTFEFEKNPYFEDEILKKRFILREEEDGERVLAKTEGTPIRWKEGKDVTVRVVTRKQKNKKTKQIRTLTETVENESFFSFFKSQIIPSDEEFQNMPEDEIRDLERVVESEFDAGVALRDKIIPRAVGWYLGEEEDEDEDSDAYGEDDEGDDDDEDDDDDDDDEDNKKDEHDKSEGTKTPGKGDCQTQ